jgi:hypothetical protein
MTIGDAPSSFMPKGFRILVVLILQWHSGYSFDTAEAIFISLARIEGKGSLEAHISSTSPDLSSAPSYVFAWIVSPPKFESLGSAERGPGRITRLAEK